MYKESNNKWTWSDRLYLRGKLADKATSTPIKLYTLASAPDLKIKQMFHPVFDSTSQIKLHAMNGQRVITILGEITDKSKYIYQNVGIRIQHGPNCFTKLIGSKIVPFICWHGDQISQTHEYNLILKPKWKRENGRRWSKAQEKFVFFQLIVNAAPLWSNEFLILVFGWHFCLGNHLHFELLFLWGQPVESAFIRHNSVLFRILLFDLKASEIFCLAVLPITKQPEMQPKSNFLWAIDLFTANTVTGAIPQRKWNTPEMFVFLSWDPWHSNILQVKIIYKDSLTLEWDPKENLLMKLSPGEVWYGVVWVLFYITPLFS